MLADYQIFRPTFGHRLAKLLANTPPLSSFAAPAIAEVLVRVLDPETDYPVWLPARLITADHGHDV